MFCCSVALFHCFGTHFMCNDCHNDYMFKYNYSEPPVKDCHGINCPLGIAHPPPSQNPREGGCFSLGCGICRSEKAHLKTTAIQQVNTNAASLPKAYIYNARPPMKGVVYPDVEIEVPDFFVRAEEILEAEIFAAEAARLAAEKERIRILNSTPVVILKPSQIAKKERAAKRKQLRAHNIDDLPAWFVDPLGEDEEEQKIEAAAAEQAAFAEAHRLEQELKAQQIAKHQEALKMLKRKIAPKKRVAHRQRK